MPITIDAIEMSLFFTSDGDSEVYMSVKTGLTYLISDYVDEEEEIPEDLYESDEYILLPTKQDLDLGKSLAIGFTSEHMPDYYDKVREIFSSKGAYGRFKDLLEYQDKLQEWYDYEDKATKQAIIEWCKEEGLELEDLKKKAQ